MLIIVYSILIISAFGKVYTDTAFNSRKGPTYELMKNLSIKIITAFLNILRMITLLFMLTIFSMCISYFSTVKHKTL